MSNPTRPSDAIPLALADRYRNSVKALKEYRDSMFPKGEKVYVDTDRYHGPGVAARDSDCPPDQLPVLLGNGNTWWYPIERCWPVGPDDTAIPAPAVPDNRSYCGCSELDINPDFGAKG